LDPRQTGHAAAQRNAEVVTSRRTGKLYTRAAIEEAAARAGITPDQTIAQLQIESPASTSKEAFFSTKLNRHVTIDEIHRTANGRGVSVDDVKQRLGIRDGPAELQ
jgi:hypothetical protein